MSRVLNNKLMVKLMAILSLVFVLGITLGLFPAKAKVGDAQYTTVQPRTVLVVDGDTIRIGTTTYRLMGFDTPETFQAKCQYERIIGAGATDRLMELVDAAKSVKLDTRGRDKYNRVLAILYVNEVDVAGIMIRDGYAVPYNGRTRRKDWCADAPPPTTSTTTPQEPLRPTIEQTNESQPSLKKD